jgi:adenylate cyclase
MPAWVSGFLVAAVLGALVGLGPLDRLDYALLDRAFAMRGARQPAPSILIVTIDEDSFDVLNSSWPFPREVFARAIRRISDDGALAIGVNIVFDGPSLRGASDDQALADALAATRNVVLGSVPYSVVDARASQLPFRRVGSVREGALGFLIDSDGAVRRAGRTMSAGDRQVPSFAVALYQRAVRAGVNAAPLPSQPEVVINYAGGPGTFPWTPLHRVLDGEVPAKTFRGKIVLLGPTSPVLHDIFRTSFASSGGMPGVEIHATVLENYLRGISLRETPRWSGALLAALAALITSILIARIKALNALLGTAALTVAIVAGVVLAFSFWQTWPRGAAVCLLAPILGFFVTAIARSTWEERLV